MCITMCITHGIINSSPLCFFAFYISTCGTVSHSISLFSYLFINPIVYTIFPMFSLMCNDPVFKLQAYVLFTAYLLTNNEILLRLT